MQVTHCKTLLWLINHMRAESASGPSLSLTLLAPGNRWSFTYGSASPLESIGFKPWTHKPRTVLGWEGVIYKMWICECTFALMMLHWRLLFCWSYSKVNSRAPRVAETNTIITHMSCVWHTLYRRCILTRYCIRKQRSHFTFYL